MRKYLEAAVFGQGRGEKLKKKMKIAGIIICGIAVLMGGWYIMYVQFGRGPAFPFMHREEVQFDLEESMVGTIADNPLMAVVENEQEAEKIAEQYNITLVSFEDGVAVYQTQEDVFEVLKRGEKNGYPQLSINFVRTTDE